MTANVNQYLENTIVDNGSNAEVVGYSVGLSSTQFYSVLFAFTVVLIFFLTFIYLLIKTFINKSCVGCKRLAKCEREIKEIKQQLIINNYFDKNVFKDISRQIQDIKEELNNG